EGYKGFGPAPAVPDFGAMTGKFRQMYWELEIEPAACDATRPPLLTQERHHAAFRWALAQVAAMPPNTYAKVGHRDAFAMFSDEYEPPFLFELRHPDHYNRRCRPGFDLATGDKYWIDAAELLHDIAHGLHRLFQRYLTGQHSDSRPPTANITPYSTPGL